MDNLVKLREKLDAMTCEYCARGVQKTSGSGHTVIISDQPRNVQCTANGAEILALPELRAELESAAPPVSAELVERLRELVTHLRAYEHPPHTKGWVDANLNCADELDEILSSIGIPPRIADSEEKAGTFTCWWDSTNNKNWFSDKTITLRDLEEKAKFAWKAAYIAALSREEKS